MHTNKKYNLGDDKGIFEKLFKQHTAEEIAGIYGCSQGLAYYYAKKFGIINKRRKYNHPDLSPSPELSYLIGVLVGDGNITKSGYDYQIRLSAKDKEFVESFAEKLAIINHKSSSYSIRKNKRGLYETQGRSKKLYYFIKGGNFWSIAEAYPIEFITGFFDSEGTITKSSKWNTWHISFSNTDMELINFVQGLLNKLRIEARVYVDKRKGQKVPRTKWAKKDYYKNSDVFKLQVLAKDHHKFARIVHPSINRKRDRLLLLLHTTKEWKDEVTCPYCGVTFIPKTYHQRFCCPRHKWLYQAIEKKEKKKLL